MDKLVNAIADFYKIDSSKVFVGVGSDDAVSYTHLDVYKRQAHAR